MKIEIEIQNLNPIEIGKAMKIFRKERGLSQSEVGEKLGVGKSQVSKMESGSKDLKLSTLIKYFHVLGVKANFEFGENKK